MAKCAHPSAINVDSIMIDDPYKAGNCKKCRMTNGRAPIIIQTPVVHLPFVFRPGEDTSVSGAIDMQPDPARRKYAEDFIDLLKRIDAYVKAKAVENSVPWLGAPKSAEVIESLYKPVLRESEKYAPNFKMKFLKFFLFLFYYFFVIYYVVFIIGTMFFHMFTAIFLLFLLMIIAIICDLLITIFF